MSEGGAGAHRSAAIRRKSNYINYLRPIRGTLPLGKSLG